MRCGAAQSSAPRHDRSAHRNQLRTLVRLAAASSLALGLAGVGLAVSEAGQVASGTVTVCAPTTTTAGSTTTVTFSSVGTCDWTVPIGVSSFTVTLWGAAGAPATFENDPNGEQPAAQGGQVVGTGGQGAEVIGTLAVPAGTTLQFDVGGAGSTDDASTSDVPQGGGFNGGGNGTAWSGGGGGASDVLAGAFGTNDRIMVAGGGGGGGGPQTSSAGGNGGNADTAGTAGASRSGTEEGSTLGGGGGGGSGEDGVVNGGTAGIATGDTECGTFSFPGDDELGDGVGGNGSTAGEDIGGTGGGGGGGGYVGGGGGGGGAFEGGECEGFAAGAGGGGGGSSYTGGADGITPTGTSVSDPASPNLPNGQIEISYAMSAVAPTTTTTPTLAFTGLDVGPLLCSGGTLVGVGLLLLGTSVLSRRRRVTVTS